MELMGLSEQAQRIGDDERLMVFGVIDNKGKTHVVTTVVKLEALHTHDVPQFTRWHIEPALAAIRHELVERSREEREGKPRRPAGW